MRKVILQIDISLDGFVSDKNDDHSWVKPDPVMNREASDLLDTVDTLLLGRVAYEDFASFWPTANFDPATTEYKIARRMNEATKLIFSRTLKEAQWGRWNNATVINGNIAEAITQLKAQPGQNMMLYAGAEIASTFIRENLFDEYRIRIHPVVVGRGKSLYPAINDQMNLKFVQSKSYANGAVLLEYQKASA